jgi:hypothetical protein
LWASHFRPICLDGIPVWAFSSDEELLGLLAFVERDAFPCAPPLRSPQPAADSIHSRRRQPHHRRSAVLGTRVRIRARRRGEAVSLPPGCVLSCPSLLLSVRKRCCSLQRADTCMLTAPLFPSIQFRRPCLIPSGTGVHWCLSISQACFFRGKREA